jgi:hypothetical protein
VTLVVGGECAFVVLMPACCAIQPSWTAVRRGMSYYGNSVVTGVPSGAGFGISISLTALELASAVFAVVLRGIRRLTHPLRVVRRVYAQQLRGFVVAIRATGSAAGPCRPVIRPPGSVTSNLTLT